MTALTYRADLAVDMTPTQVDDNFRELERRTASGWKDLTSSIFGAPGGVAAPALANFGAAGTLQRQEYAFALNDYVWLAPFHVNHDVKRPTAAAYIHIHWAANGTNVNTVKWEFHMQRALGHDQAAFAAPVLLGSVTQASTATYRHMIAEVAIANILTLTEPDELILISLKRVTNGGTDNTDPIFGLMVDFHYESDRDTTPGKAPDFYV